MGKSTIKNSDLVKKDVVRTKRANQFDRLAKTLKEVLKSQNITDKDNDGEFYGYVLYENRLTVDEFKKLFKNNEEFYAKVIKEGDNTATSNSADIAEIYVSIPQVTDFLPKPNLKVLMELISYKDKFNIQNQRNSNNSLPTPPQPGSNPKTNQNDKSIEKVIDAVKETIDIITMYPKVYRYCESKETATIASACKVYLPSADGGKMIPTMAYGIYQKGISGIKNISGLPSIKDEIEKIIKANERP